MFAQPFYVVDQMRSRVVRQVAPRGRSAGATLVEYYDPVTARIKEPPVNGRRARTGPAMEKQHGNTARIA